MLTVQRCDWLVHIGKVTQANFHVNDPVFGIVGDGGVVEGRLPLFLPPAKTQEPAHRGRGQEMCWKSLSVQYKKCWPSLQTHLRSNDENMTMIHEGELCCPNGEIYLLNEKRIWSFKRLQRNIPILILTSWEIGLLLSLISISCFKCIFHVCFISSRWCKCTSEM